MEIGDIKYHTFINKACLTFRWHKVKIVGMSGNELECKILESSHQADIGDTWLMLPYELYDEKETSIRAAIDIVRMFEKDLKQEIVKRKYKMILCRRLKEQMKKIVQNPKPELRLV